MQAYTAFSFDNALSPLDRPVKRFCQLPVDLPHFSGVDLEDFPVICQQAVCFILHVGYFCIDRSAQSVFNIPDQLPLPEPHNLLRQDFPGMIPPVSEFILSPAVPGYMPGIVAEFRYVTCSKYDRVVETMAANPTGQFFSI